MTRPPIEKRLLNIEQGISDIKEKLGEINPCEPQSKEREKEEGN